MTQWFEDKGQYIDESPLPSFLNTRYSNLSLVRIYPEIEKVQPGWGVKEFAHNQSIGAFRPKRALRFYERYKQPFAIVMRSIPYLCVDIDGKNGGIETSQILFLPETAAELSKSGNGYHLFYEIPNAVWSKTKGYDQLPDLNGMIPGVDIRGCGIVYHYPGQRWNGLAPAPIPKSLEKLVSRTATSRYQSRLTKQGADALDPDERVILHDELKESLAQKMPQGARNSRMFAIGAKMHAAGYPSWDTALYDRGQEIGLDLEEVTSIIKSIEKYT